MADDLSLQTGRGLDTLTNGCHAFLNVTSRLRVDEIDELIPPAAAVLEILETIDVTLKVIDACRRLKERAAPDAAIAFEGGAWDDAAAAARHGGFDPDLLPSAYTSAVRWAQDVARGGITAPPAP